MGPHIILEPWLLLQGWGMYRELPDHHTPLMPLLMALAQGILGDELRAGKLVLVGLLLLTLGLVYVLTARLGSKNAALWAAVLFVGWSPFFKLGQLRFEAFLMPLYLLAWVVWPPAENRRLGLRALLAGGVLGVAFLIKQQAAVFLIFLLAWQSMVMLREQLPRPQLFRALAGAGLGFGAPVLLALAVYLLWGGRADALWFWVVVFNTGDLARLLALAPTPDELRQLALVLLFVPLYLAWAGWHIRSRQPGWGSHGAPLSLLLGGLLLAIPRYGSEHLQPALPGLAILTGLFLETLRRRLLRENRWKQAAYGLMVAIILGQSLGYGVQLTLQASPPNQPRYIHEYSLLPPLAEQVRQQVGVGECPYIFPEDEANSNLYFFLRCPPPGRLWLFTAYPWFSRFNLPQQALNAFQTASPRWVIYFPLRWGVEEHNPLLTAYIKDHYTTRATLVFENSAVWLMERQ